MGDTNSIWNELTVLLAAASDEQLDPQDLRREMSLEGLGLSSLMVINLVMELEQKFGITVLNEEFDFKNMNVTAGDVESLVESKLGRGR
jgi:acyl carrier protein